MSGTFDLTHASEVNGKMTLNVYLIEGDSTIYTEKPSLDEEETVTVTYVYKHHMTLEELGRVSEEVSKGVEVDTSARYELLPFTGYIASPPVDGYAVTFTEDTEVVILCEEDMSPELPGTARFYECDTCAKRYPANEAIINHMICSCGGRLRIQ